MSGTPETSSANAVRSRQIRYLTLAIGAMLLTVLCFSRPFAAIAQDEYPAPFVPEINPVDDGSNTADSAEAYPAPDVVAPGIIGSEALPSPLDFPPADAGAETAVESVDQGSSSSGLLFLWGGFTAAMLIFATAVVGSVVLFSRRAE